jgi:hypothetical protein
MYHIISVLWVNEVKIDFERRNPSGYLLRTLELQSPQNLYYSEIAVMCFLGLDPILQIEVLQKQVRHQWS